MELASNHVLVAIRTMVVGWQSVRIAIGLVKIAEQRVLQATRHMLPWRDHLLRSVCQVVKKRAVRNVI
jgi:hypothetical protein